MDCPRPLKPARCPSLRSSAKAWAGDREERHELSVGLPGGGVWKEAEQERASRCGGMGQVQGGNEEQMLPPACLWCVWGRGGLEKFAACALPIMSSPSGL